MKLYKLFVMMIASFSLVNAETKQPNIVFILTDDQSWDSLGFMGGAVHTPRLDKMAEEGLYLSDFNVTSTVCSPSRYSFLTGRYAGRCEGEHFMKEHPKGDQIQVENIGELEPDQWNLASILQKNGYNTGFVGKSHIIRHDWMEGFKPSGVMETYPKDADPKTDKKTNAKIKRNHDRWCEEMKKYGFDYADGVYGANLLEIQNEALNVHNLEWTVSKAFDFLEQDRGDQPFFLFFSTTLHHGPSPWANRFSLNSDIHMTGEGYIEETLDVMPSRKDVLARNKAAGRKPNKAYALWLDDGVGAILDKLAELKLEEDTLVVFVPDHGSFRHGKATLHEYGMRVPMILRWKGTIKPKSTYDEIVANVDFAPTLLDLCGVPQPEDYVTDGLSFKSALYGSDEPHRQSVFGELGHSRAIKTKDWKYIAVRYPSDVQTKIDNGKKFKGFKGDMLELPYLTRNAHLGHHAAAKNPNYFQADQLYNLKSDREENDNVYAEHPDVVARLKSLLSAELKTFEDRPFGEFTETDKPK